MAEPAPLRFGILGAAKIAPNALITPAKKVDGVVVSAIAARDQARAREFARSHGIARVLASYSDLIADPEIDVIYNPLPNSLHCEWTILALRAGKHVLCEKPLASNAQEAERMGQAAQETGMILGEAFHYCYHPLADRIREILRDGSLGRLLHLEAHFSVPIPQPNIRFEWMLAGGATMDLGCYPLHMIRYFSGLTPLVRTATARLGPPNIDVAMDTELELPRGITARVTCSMAADAVIGASFIARGDRGELRVTNPVGPHWGHLLTLKTPSGEVNEKVEGETTYTYQLRAFAAAVRGEGSFPTDGAEGVINMRVIDDVYRAAGLTPRGSAR
jgi:predicted dehydrogenase